MYGLWGKRLKQLNRKVKEWMREEKENKKTEVYVDLLGFKREHVLPAIRLYNRLVRQEFVRYSDEQALRVKIHFAVLAYNKLIDEYSTPPEGLHDPDSEISTLVDYDRLTNIEV